MAYHSRTLLTVHAYSSTTFATSPSSREAMMASTQLDVLLRCFMRHNRTLIHQSQQMLLRVKANAAQILAAVNALPVARSSAIFCLVARFPCLRIVLVEGDHLSLSTPLR